MRHFRVEYLPRELMRLRQDFPTVFCVRVVAKVAAFVDETLPQGVDHDAERIAVFLEAVADDQIAEFRRVAVPPHCVATGPVAAGRRADVERHCDAGASIETSPADLCQIPSGTQVARPPFGIRLEASRREHDSTRRHGRRARISAYHDAVDAAVIRDQSVRACAVPDLDARALRRLRQEINQARSAARYFDGQAAPE